MFIFPFIFVCPIIIYKLLNSPFYTRDAISRKRIWSRFPPAISKSLGINLLTSEHRHDILLSLSLTHVLVHRASFNVNDGFKGREGILFDHSWIMRRKTFSKEKVLLIILGVSWYFENIMKVCIRLLFSCRITINRKRRRRKRFASVGFEEKRNEKLWILLLSFITYRNGKITCLQVYPIQTEW